MCNVLCQALQAERMQAFDNALMFVLIVCVIGIILSLLGLALCYRNEAKQAQAENKQAQEKLIQTQIHARKVRLGLIA